MNLRTKWLILLVLAWTAYCMWSISNVLGLA
jgi:hypothetical protein